MGRYSGLGALGERLAQGTLEYAVVTGVFVAVIVALGALWRAATDGALSGLVEEAASHVLDGSGAIDIALF
ncbi:hypothetical protein [Collinsella sp. D33t1_170424_A12]|uniref:hypothetical protein n=1 Tax=Collinsella sp. D33t1_170424_A12 TaxID=2787135 RepID=UPI001899C878|nr:hypothetical protein [Collinsella sp. D33t1_170424_A12]